MKMRRVVSLITALFLTAIWCAGVGLHVAAEEQDEPCLPSSVGCRSWSMGIPARAITLWRSPTCRRARPSR